MIEICLNFVKKTRAHKDVESIGYNYLTGYFIFDVVATLPGLINNESLDYYYLKGLRLVHVYRLTQPLQILLSCALQKYSKKRQNDLATFAGLILYVIYTSHLNACIWLWIGTQQNCSCEIGEDNCTEPSDEDLGSGTTDPYIINCTESWVYENQFD